MLAVARMSLSFPAVTHQGLLTFLALVSLVAQQLLASRRHPELPLLLPGLNPLFLGSISCCILVDFFLLLSDFSNVLKKDMGGVGVGWWQETEGWSGRSVLLSSCVHEMALFFI